MQLKNLVLLVLCILSFNACQDPGTNVTDPKGTNAYENESTPFVWQNANVYFLLTDRFNNGDESNDVNFGRIKRNC